MPASPLHAPPYRRFRALLHGWRADAGLSQRALAARLGKPASYVHKCEAGERRVDAVEFVAWTVACGIDPRDAIATVRREALKS